MHANLLHASHLQSEDAIRTVATAVVVGSYTSLETP